MGGEDRRKGDFYEVSDAERKEFAEDGYGVVSEEEMVQLEAEYMKFLTKDIYVEGRDFCDMSGDYSRPIEDYSIINIMLPRKYNPELEGSIYERRAASIAAQLCGSDMALDYDQLLAKPPNRPDGVFMWHQDLAYWPVTKDTRTTSFWLAIDDSNKENGCLQFVPGSHLEASLRSHDPAHGDREKSHTLHATLRDTDVPKYAELSRGDVTVHHERILHGSGGNMSGSSWRRAWVLAYRAQSTVIEERNKGFTHSHNDKLEVLNEVGKEG
eukprot:jgi/Mesen1/1568/ME000134S00683